MEGVRPRTPTRLAALVLLGALAAGCSPPTGSGTAQPPAPDATATSTSAPPATSSPAPSTRTTPPTSSAQPTSAAPTSAPPTSAPPTTPAPTADPTAPAPPPTPAPPADGTMRPGDSGPQVLALQQRLTELGYWLGTPDGTYGGLTTQAVLALQGVAGLQRDGKAGPQTAAALAAGAHYRPTSSSGVVTEIDRDKGVIAFVRDGQVRLVVHTSTGSYEEYTNKGRTLLADTPAGSYSVTWAYDGMRNGDLGELYRPRYFHPDGIAVHGYPSVPAYPASHGCARVSNAAIDMIWRDDLMPKGSAVVVL